MRAPDELTRLVLGVIQRTCDVQGNVTMIHLAQNIADELTSRRGAHLLVMRGRIYDTCSCGWYGLDHSTHAAERIAPPGQATD